MTDRNCKAHVAQSPARHQILAMLAALAVVPLWGDTIAELAAKGIYDHAVMATNVSAGATTTLAAPVTASARTTVVKGGEGTLVLPASAFRTGSPSRVQVAGGKVVYTNDLANGVASGPDTLSSEIQAKLAFWGSVKDTPHLVMAGDGIEKIYDMRETDVAAPKYVYLEAEHFGDAAAPALKKAVFVRQYHTVTNTREMAYFGDYGSGVSMKFLKPDGAAYKTRPQETVAVYGFPWESKSYGFLFGNCLATSEHALWNEGNALPWADVWGPVSGDTAVWVDGVPHDRNTGAVLPNGFHVLQVRYNTLPTGESNLNNFENALFSTKAEKSS